MESNKQSINARMRDLIKEMIQFDIKYVDARDEFEKLFITEVLGNNGFNHSEAAKKLGLHRNTLNNKLRAYKLKRKQ